MKLNSEWSQDVGSLTLRLPLRRIDPAKIDVTMFPSFVKINIPERSVLQFVDLFGEIDFPNSKWAYSDGQIVLSLVKAAPGFWDSFEASGLPKQELRTRRQQAIDRRTAWETQRTAQAASLRNTVQKNAVEEKYNQEREIQNKIKEKAAQEKNQALDAIFEKPAEESVVPVRKSPGELVAYEGEPDFKTEIDHAIFERPNGQILSQADLGTFKPKTQGVPELPVRSLRESGPVQIPFSKKIYPNLAAREQHFNEPPQPKGSKQANKTDGENYLWFKERGDNFQRNKDFPSAANAYQEALKLNPESLETLLNFAALKMRLLDFGGAFQLVENALDLLKNKHLDQEISLVVVNALKKKTWLLAQIGNLEEALETTRQLERLSSVQSSQTTEELSEVKQTPTSIPQTRDVEEDVLVIGRRLESQTKKVAADELVEAGKLEEGLAIYQNILETEPENEKIWANCAFLQAKLGRGEAAEESLDRAVGLVRLSLSECTLDSSETHRNNESLKFLIKLHLRKCELFLAANRLDEAEAAVKAARYLDEQNPALLERSKEIKRAKRLVEFGKKREVCRQQMAEEDFSGALETLNHSEKLLDLDRSPLEVLKTSANKVVCLLKLEKFDHVIAETLRALKIISGIKANYMSRTYADNQSFLDDLEQKMRMRKAFAFSSLGQVFNAKQEVERVLQLNPTHAEAKRILDDFKLAVC